jgi:hypothetical protein
MAAITMKGDIHARYVLSLVGENTAPMTMFTRR